VSTLSKERGELTSDSALAEARSAYRQDIHAWNMLKWDHQPERRSRSWQNSIREHRRRVEKQLRKVPSLKIRNGEAVEEAYEAARSWCQIETHIPEVDFPFSCPYDWEEIMTRSFVYEDERAKK
jgi:hypothetical protein